MAYQSGRNILVAYKPEVTFGTLEDATSGKVFRPNTGGLNLTKEPIRSNENRRDGQMTRGRHGSRSVAGRPRARAWNSTPTPARPIATQPHPSIRSRNSHSPTIMLSRGL